jgi:hypothetical protein
LQNSDKKRLTDFSKIWSRFWVRNSSIPSTVFYPNDSPLFPITIHKKKILSQRLKNGLQGNKEHQKMQDNRRPCLQHHQVDSQRRLKYATAEMAV